MASDIMKKLASASKKASPELTKYAGVLSEKDVDPTHHIDTGSLALNRIISSSIFGGIPDGGVIALAGDAQTGKSFLANRIIANAQKDHDYICVHYDTEGALSKTFATNLGVDPEKLFHVNIDTAQQVRNHCINTLTPIMEENPEQKFIIVLDSLGNLSSAKEQSDIEKGKENADMGERAKAVKSMLKEMTKFCTKNKFIFIYTNHTYKDTASAPNPMYATTVQAGGKQTEYMAHVVLMLSKRNEKDDKTKEVTGDIITVKSQKNRFCKSKRSIQIYINYQTGPNRYFGLLDDMVEADLIEKVNEKNFIIKHMDNKKLHINKIYKKGIREEVFAPEVLEELDTFCKEHYKYASISESEEELEEELENL